MSERDLIRERLARQRQARQTARRKRQRRMHGFVGAALLIGLLSVVPRYPGILILLLPPLAVALAAGVGFVILRIPPIRAAVLRWTLETPGFWSALFTGAAVLGLAVASAAWFGAFGGVPVRQW